LGLKRDKTFAAKLERQYAPNIRLVVDNEYAAPHLRSLRRGLLKIKTDYRLETSDEPRFPGVKRVGLMSSHNTRSRWRSPKAEIRPRIQGESSNVADESGRWVSTRPHA